MKLDGGWAENVRNRASDEVNYLNEKMRDVEDRP